MEFWRSVVIIIMSAAVNFRIGVMGVTYVDLSYSIGEQTPIWPDHRRMERHPEPDGTVNEDGEWMASSYFTVSEHTSTHIDAPYHVFRDTWTLSDIPTARLLDVPGVMIDLSWKIMKSGKELKDYAVVKEDILAWERKHGKIPKGSVVLVRTGWGDKFRTDPVGFIGSEPKCCSFPSLGLSASKLFVERGAYGVGVDVVSIDVGYSENFPSHSYLGSRNVYMMENVANLHILPPKGFKLFLFPLRMDTGSGSPLRIFATLK